MPSCAAYGCTNRDEKEQRAKGLTFHRFPLREPKRLFRWLLNMRRDAWEPSQKSHLCSNHFTAECFDRTGHVTRLWETAQPTIFNFRQPPNKKSRKALTPRVPKVSPQSRVTQVHKRNEPGETRINDDKEQHLLDSMDGLDACTVINCKNKKTPGCNKTFHFYPHGRPSMLKRWIANIGRPENWIPSNSATICSDHFEETCFERTGCTARLRFWAVPTRYMYNPNIHRGRRKKLLAEEDEHVPELDEDECLFTRLQLEILDELSNQLVMARKKLMLAKKANVTSNLELSLIVKNEIIRQKTENVVHPSVAAADQKSCSTIVINIVDDGENIDDNTKNVDNNTKNDNAKNVAGNAKNVADNAKNVDDNAKNEKRNASPDVLRRSNRKMSSNVNKQEFVYRKVGRKKKKVPTATLR